MKLKPVNYGLIIVLCLTCLGVQSQDFTLKPKEVKFGKFRMIACNSMYQRMGEVFNEGNVLKASFDTSYMLLLHHSGAIIEINGKGSFAVNDLENRIAQYKLKKPGKPIHIKINQSKKSNKEQVYPVIFPVAGRQLLPKYTIHLPRTIEVLESKLSFTWDVVQDAVYEVQLKDDYGEIIWMKTTSQNKITLDISKLKDTHPKGTFAIQVIIKQERQNIGTTNSVVITLNPEIAQVYKKFQAETKTTNNLFRLLLEAYFWTNRQYYWQANLIYQRLSKEYPNYPVFSTVYKYFRVRNYFEGRVLKR